MTAREANEIVDNKEQLIDNMKTIYRSILDASLRGDKSVVVDIHLSGPISIELERWGYEVYPFGVGMNIVWENCII